MVLPPQNGSYAPWVRIVIVNFNGGSLVQACVDALAKQTLRDFEVVVVDNASTDGSARALILPDDRFRLIENPRNIGFAGANNLGAQGVQAPWIAALNPDTDPDRTWLEELRSGTERHPGTRMFGSTLVTVNDPSVVDGFGDVLSIAGIAWRSRHGQPVATLPERDGEVFSPSGAAALYASDIYLAAGGFDDSFFCYLEDVDLGLRLRLANEHCIQLRHAIVLHHGSALTGQNSAFTTYHTYRNRLWLIFKDLPLALIPIAVAANLVCSFVMLIANWRRTPARSALKGLWHGLTGLHAPLAQRGKVQAKRKLSAWAVAGLLVWSPFRFRQ